MTRLKTEWVEYMIDGMASYNQTLKEKIGLDLAELAMRTFHMSQADFDRSRECNRVAVVPITQGEGIIGSFSESVAAIVRSMGFQAEVMPHTDIDGIYDGYLKGCNIFFFADDIRYLALNTKTNRASDNNYATALGFIEVLTALMEKHGKKIASEKILQIGHGIVGREAVRILEARGIDFDIYDKDEKALAGLACRKLSDKEEIKNYKYILDFTNEGGWLRKEYLAETILYASPGVPYSMEPEAEMRFEDKAVHDNLEIGTAIMLGEALQE